MLDLVTVIIPTYGRADNLVRAVESVAAQTYKNIEIIVVDDNNPGTIDRKNTEHAIERLRRNIDIVYIKHAVNKNGAAARNTGLRASQGKYIAFLDDDDEFLPAKIDKQVDFLNNNDQVDGCYCKANLVENNNVYYRSSYCKSGDLALDVLSLKSECFTPSLCITKAALMNIGGFNEKFRRHQDFELLLKYFRHYNLACVDEYLLNVYTDCKNNQPSLQQLEMIKKEFLAEFKEYIDSYDKSVQRLIYQQHNFELFVSSIKARNLISAIKYLYRSKPNYQLIKNNADKIKKVTKRAIGN